MTNLGQLRAEAPAYEDPASSAPIPIREITGETKIGGEDISLTYRAPSNPADTTDPTLLLIIHGWGGPELAYSELGAEAARRGKPSLTYGEGRSLGLVGDLNPLNLLRVAQLSSKAAWAAMRYAREEFGHDESDLYGHSWGGQTAVNVALHKPEHVRGVILDGSCGLDEHSLPTMIGRTGQFARDELLPALGSLARKPGPRVGAQALHYVWRHPGRTLAEGLNAGSTNLHARIRRLGSRGIWVSAIQSPSDTYFKLEEVRRDSQHLFGEHFHVRDDPDSNHLAPQLDPEGTADLIMSALLLRLNGRDLEPATDTSLSLIVDTESLATAV